jgi:regulatory protein
VEERSDKKPKASPRELALARLNVREYAAKEMADYLARKRVDPREAAEVVADLVRSGLIDDRRYARIIARSQASRGKGPRYVQQKLKMKGVKIDVRELQTLLEETSGQDELSRAREIVERRYPQFAEDIKERKRAWDALLRRGFSMETVRKCLQR